jgi:hypothetical protein
VKSQENIQKAGEGCRIYAKGIKGDGRSKIR